VEKLAEAFEVEVADLFPKVESPLPLVFEEERNRGGGHDIRITATDSAGAVDSGELKLKHWFDAIVAELEVRGRYEEAEEVGRMRDRVLMA
jgi:hypothetical protein